MFFNIVLEVLARASSQEKKERNVSKQKGRSILPLNDMILYIENPNESTKKKKLINLES